MSRMRGLSGKTAVVTGGARGVGEGIVHELGSHGVRVAILDVLPSDAGIAALEESGGSGLSLVCDVTDRAAVEAAADKIRSALGDPAFLVNNAGGSGAYVHILDLDDELWQASLALNLTASCNTVRTFCPAMVREGAGAVVNIASTAAHFAWPHNAHYMAAKAGLVAFTRGVALDLGRTGVRANTVSPGSVRTPVVSGVLADPDFVREEDDATVLGRMAWPEDVARVVAFLLSDEAGYLTGIDVLCDGGYSITGQSHHARLALLAG
jgi:2-hydroxycyclohexanecarboxyl-CoA dehydrogenase